MGLKPGDRYQTGDVSDGDHTPDEDRAADTGADRSTEKRAIGSNSDRCDTLVLLRNKLMAALIFAKIPDADVSTTIAGDEFALIGMNDHVVDLDAMGVISLNVAASGVPDLHGSCNWSDVETGKCCGMQYRLQSL